MVSFSIDCVIGLGANLGHCERTFAMALDELAKIGTLTSLSNLYENPAVGGPPQPDYLNGAVRLATHLAPDALLDVLQKIEAAAGRERVVPWGPRTLDLDLLWINGQAVMTSRLVVPHPRLAERAFALKPLLEVAPMAACPVTKVPYEAALDIVGISSLRLVSTASGPPWRWQRVRSRGLQPAPAAYP
ncbi:MAG: 2-amino-4-hydroxy-6-hydroxymethyldihydropteridine diphosphokinase [Polyangiaceae bacterium]